jgi:hypothetical protein
MNVVDTITEMEIRRFEALLKADIGALEILCSEQLVFTLSTGERDDKRTYLEKIASGFFTTMRWSIPQTRSLWWMELRLCSAE